MIRSYLLGVVGRPEADLPTYGDLHHRFGGGYQNQGHFLGEIWKDCVANGEPDLTVLVVNAETRLPSWFEGREWKDSPELRQRWRAAIDAVEAWQWSNTRFL